MFSRKCTKQSPTVRRGKKFKLYASKLPESRDLAERQLYLIDDAIIIVVHWVFAISFIGVCVWEPIY